MAELLALAPLFPGIFHSTRSTALLWRVTYLHPPLVPGSSESDQLFRIAGVRSSVRASSWCHSSTCMFTGFGCCAGLGCWQPPRSCRRCVWRFLTIKLALVTAAQYTHTLYTYYVPCTVYPIRACTVRRGQRTRVSVTQRAPGLALPSVVATPLERLFQASPAAFAVLNAALQVLRCPPPPPHARTPLHTHIHIHPSPAPARPKHKCS
jgi:hypothetical protein